jgi:hypothetical protein
VALVAGCGGKKHRKPLKLTDCVYCQPQTTFDALRDWITELRSKAPADIVLAVAGNKSDLAPQRRVSTAEAQQFATSIRAVYFETSALDATHVTMLFESAGGWLGLSSKWGLIFYLFIIIIFNLSPFFSPQAGGCQSRRRQW